jgi:hypothetical protein
LHFISRVLLPVERKNIPLNVCYSSYRQIP